MVPKWRLKLKKERFLLVNEVDYCITIFASNKKFDVIGQLRDTMELPKSKNEQEQVM